MVASMMLNWTQALVGCPVTASALRKEEMNEVHNLLYELETDWSYTLSSVLAQPW